MLAAAAGWAARLLGAFLVLYHLAIGIYGPPTNAVFLPVHLGVALALLFLIQPLKPWDRPHPLAVVDLACIAVSLWSTAYFLGQLEDWQLRFADMRPVDVWTAAAVSLVVLEAVRRTVGWALVVMAVAFGLHALFADQAPGVLFGPPVSFSTLMQTFFIGDAGIFGVPVLVMAQYVVLFLLFGRLLQSTGAGAFFTRIAFALFGHRIGGPAKAAVVSSGLFGTMSGSGVSNVLTTGAFTIPMMTRLGYRPPFAAGVEASAAVGGAIMPPVMGAVAFMMAEFMGVPYVEIAIAAAIPAILYYVAIYATVHFEARRMGLAGIARSELPNPWKLLLREGYLLIPLLLIVVLLLVGWSIVLVAVVTCLGTFLVSLVRPASRLSPLRLASAVDATARTTGTLTATCACAGLIIGAIFATGLSFQVSQAVVSLAGENLWLLLVISALIAIVLGTGLTASAVYITMVATIIPVLKLAGVPDMGAHMFAFYYGVVSDITPPTALACVAAAGIARANPMKAMLEGSRLGIAAFVVPMVFVFQPALLMRGSWWEVGLASLTACAGLLCLSAALAGYLLGPLGAIRRAALLLAFVLLILPASEVEILGVLILAACMAPDLLRRGNPAPELRTATGLAELIDKAEDTGGPPPDFAKPLGWAVIAVVALGIGWMGSLSLHATQPLLWLAGLAAVSAVFVLGLRITPVAVVPEEE
jgi:TRAP transporter 4TM/12TM fusion protein